MTAYNPGTYVPGNAWETIEHFQRAAAAPRINEVLDSVGDTTTPSYFEFRSPVDGNDRSFALSIDRASGAGSFNCALERSLDNGVSWQPINTFDSPVSNDIRLNNLAMFRVRVLSLGAGTTLRVSLIQSL